MINALFVSIFMCLSAFWVFAIAFIANVLCAKNLRIALAWWAFIFPNVGFMLSMSMVGKELESEAIVWVTSTMTIRLVVIWLVFRGGVCESGVEAGDCVAWEG
jgi:tellurite resistance protein TehA-like permease